MVEVEMGEEVHRGLVAALRERDSWPRLVPDGLVVARDRAVTWLHQASLEQDWPAGTFALAAALLDRFLDACPGVRAEQAQLAAVTCMVLAEKKKVERIEGLMDALLKYSDGSVLREEVKAWEALVLDKLGWNLETVTVCDYLPPLSRLLAPRGEEDEEEEDARSALVSNGELISAVSLRDAHFCRLHHPACVAASSLLLASPREREEHLQSLPLRSGDGRSEDDSIPAAERCLREVTPSQLRSCTSDLESLLWTHLPHPSSSSSSPSSSPPSSNRHFSSPSSSKIPPCNQSPSPLARNTSTPKSSREPLRENRDPVGVERTRRALPMIPLEEEAAAMACDSATNKENNDSAIGLNATADYSKSLSPATSSSSAPPSSKGSSPDSGASSASPKSVKSEGGVAELDRLLGSTKISPLAKTDN